MYGNDRLASGGILCQTGEHLKMEIRIRVVPPGSNTGTSHGMLRAFRERGKSPDP